MPVPAAISLAPAIAGTAFNTVQAIAAGRQQKRDKEELARLTPSYYKIQDEYFKNRNDALSLAQGGLPQASKDIYTDEINRGLGTGISAINEGGGTPNDIARLFDSYSSGLNRLTSEDAQRQIDNIKYYHQINKDLAGQKTIQWDVNEYQPYQNKLKELTQRIGADKQNISNGIQGAIGSVQAGVTSMGNAGLLGKLFAKPATPKQPSLPTVTDPFTDETGFNPAAKSANPYNWYQTQSKTPGIPASQQSDTYSPEFLDQLGKLLESYKAKV